jgi:hypothetical protein
MVPGPVHVARHPAGARRSDKEKTAQTLKSPAVHLTLHPVHVRILPVAPWTSALHPPAFGRIHTPKETEKSSHFSE